MENLETLIFNVKGNDFTIKFPNIGDFKKIQVLKQSLSGGQYFNLLNSNLVDSMEALDIIDIEAHLSVMCPTLLSKIDDKVGSFGELGMLDFNELKEAYSTQFVPWWSNIMKMLKNKNV